jgi:hypothetical protein
MYSLNKKRDITYLLYRDEMYSTEIISFAGGYFQFKIINVNIPDIMYRDFKLQTTIFELYLKHDNNYTLLDMVHISDIGDDNIVTFSHISSFSKNEQSLSSAKKFREYNIKKLMKNEI